MFSEKSSLIEKKGSPFYGSYKERNVLEEIHRQNKKKQRQLLIVTLVILALTLLGIGITLAITLPPLLEKTARMTLDPVNPTNLFINSSSVLKRFENAGVSSDDPLCSELGKKILLMNGSAVDSAIGAGLCMGVVAPQSSGLGGGMFMTIYSENTMYALNAREKAPQDIDENVYFTNPSASVKGGLAVGIPGELSGYWMAHKKFGLIPWADIVKLVSDIARNGFTVSRHLAKSLKDHQKTLLKDPSLRSEFIDPLTGLPYVAGDLIKRPKLARTLEAIKVGPASFYNGTLAEKIVKDINHSGGIFSKQDLSSFSAEWVQPIVVKLKNNLTIFSLPFPSSGPVVAMSLAILDGYGKLLKEPTQIENGIDQHRLIEVLKFAETHRAYISDPDFDETGRLDELLEKMISPEYPEEIRGKIQDYKTFTDPKHYGAIYENPVDTGTAHVSVIGPNGDAVSLTTTINLSFGAGFMGNATGIIFNNELQDFSLPNKSSAYGLPPNPYNYVEPGKQPASSMAPIILLNANGQPVLATGGAGGVSIVPSVISSTWGALYRNLDIKAAIDYPRFSIKFNTTPEVHYEYGFPSYLINDLERKGHRTRRLPLDKFIGNVNSVCMTKWTEEILANADHRKSGGSAGF